MKKFIAISAMTLTMSTYSGPAVATEEASAVAPTTQSANLNWLVEYNEKQTLLEAQAAAAAEAAREEAERKQAIKDNTVKLHNVIEALTDRVGKTRYVFSGSTPKGWDCSGLVKWAYGELGFELDHRASRQQNAGDAVDQPKLGDIIVFKYNGRESAYHVGIYLYPDTMIHAGGGKGDSTSIVSISKFAGKHSEVTFRRLLETE